MKKEYDSGDMGAKKFKTKNSTNKLTNNIKESKYNNDKQ